ncbi:MAG: transposase [Gemmataceae bacterium]
MLIAAGSTRDALRRQVGWRREVAKAPVAGRMRALLDVPSRLPWRVWYEADPNAHDARCWERWRVAVPDGALVVFALGFTDCGRCAALTARGVTWLTRAKTNLRDEVERGRVPTAVRDRLVWIGTEATRPPVRLIEVQTHGTGYRDLTNTLDLGRLPTTDATALYRPRWRVEDAFSVVSRLLGLAYFYSGAENAVAMQLWTTWLLYTVLVDLTDAGAERRAGPGADLSLAMVDRSLYVLIQATRQVRPPIRSAI